MLPAILSPIKSLVASVVVLISIYTIVLSASVKNCLS